MMIVMANHRQLHQAWQDAMVSKASLSRLVTNLLDILDENAIDLVMAASVDIDKVIELLASELESTNSKGEAHFDL